MELLKRPEPAKTVDIFANSIPDDDQAGERIRCPLCEWSPTPSSCWTCSGAGTPEPAFDGCGNQWNTFSTHGRCPSCQHQWKWTSCLRCSGWSLHEDWYECG